MREQKRKREEEEEQKRFLEKFHSKSEKDSSSSG
jgi:hypothetical protein